jgi:septal ring factor EnvC (AmiA/AmiB activator)
MNKSNAVKSVFDKLLNKAKTSSSNEITVEELRASAQKILENPVFNADPRYEKIISALEKAVNYDYAKEDKFIKKLEKFNEEKYGTLEQIIETEISINKAEMRELREKLNKLEDKRKENKEEFKQDEAEFISNNKDDFSTRISGYNKLLDKYNGDLFKENNEDYYEYEDALVLEKKVLDKKV